MEAVTTARTPKGTNLPTRVGVHSLLFLCSIQNFVTTCQSKIPSPPNSKNHQNPKSKIPKIQNPKSPKSKIPKFPNPNFTHKDLLPKSKIQNPQNPKSPKSKIQNPQNPKSCIPQLPKSKRQNPRQNPKYGALGPHKKNCYITIQNPKSKIQNIWPKKFGLGILDFGFGIPAPKSKIQTPQDPKSKITKIQNLKSQNPKSKIPKIQNLKSPKSKIQNHPNPKSSAEIQNLGRCGPHVKNCFLMIQNPKSKIPKIRPKKLGFWILGILNFGFWGFWILDFGFWDLGDFRAFEILGRCRGCTTRQTGDGPWRSEARIHPGLPLGATSKPTVSNRGEARRQI